MNGCRFVVVAWVCLLSASTARAQDAVTADPQHYKVEIENDQVRVLRATYAPGEKSPMHRHAPHVFVFVSSGHFRFALPDGKTVDPGPAQAGDAGWADADLTHAPVNIGSSPAEVVVIELKRTGSPAFKPVTLDAVTLRPEQFRIVVENEHVRVVRNTAPGGRPGFLHEHPSNVVIRISGGPDGQKPGTVTWSGPQKHGDPKNVAPAGEVIIVELKSDPARKPTR
jgi:quercetin dioxygenase-like cupin family protein